MGNPKAEPKAAVNVDVEEAIRHLCMAIMNLTCAVTRTGQDTTLILRSVTDDVGCALQCLKPPAPKEPAKPLPASTAAAQAAANRADDQDVGSPQS